LRLDREELRRRLLGRGAPAQQVVTALAEAGALDRGDATGVCVDTTGLTVAEVTRLVRDRTKGWRNADAARRQPRQWLSDIETCTTTTTEGPVLWLCGPTGVGKSRVGWEVYQRIRRAGDPAAFIDLDQLGFLRPAASDDPRHHRLKARNLAALWRNYRTAGAQFLVVVGPVENRADLGVYIREVPAATITLCRLHATRDQLTDRIMLRGQGQGWPAPGDLLKGQPKAHLLRVADQAGVQADALDRSALGDLRIDTDDRSVADVADAICARIDLTHTPRDTDDGQQP
ncbi:MAG: hypothetical protein ACRDSH_17320, partial [Pseudonocardiaceae bacterium]